VRIGERVMSEAVTVLEPHLASGQGGTKGRMMVGTVKGDMHDIGKNLVGTMLRGVGYEVTQPVNTHKPGLRRIPCRQD